MSDQEADRQELAEGVEVDVEWGRYSNEASAIIVHHDSILRNKRVLWTYTCSPPPHLLPPSCMQLGLLVASCCMASCITGRQSTASRAAAEPVQLLVQWLLVHQADEMVHRSMFGLAYLPLCHSRHTSKPKQLLMQDEADGVDTRAEVAIAFSTSACETESQSPRAAGEASSCLGR